MAGWTKWCGHQPLRGSKGYDAFFEKDNAPEPFYVVIEDSVGKVAVVTHPDTSATLGTKWRRWDILLSDLEAEGIDVTSISKLYIGLGDRDEPQAGGSGLIYIDDIGVMKRIL
ncbi:MAG: hypothetical protein JSW66_02700 [Phycisphaerales bacterium]|nr:MAG: hypothetical protein JSW66_02700 [Phycisphaerales bacterium]